MNQIYKYLWLIDTIYRAGKITFDDINRNWMASEAGKGEQLSKRTFHKWRSDIERIFHLTIDNENCGDYRYYFSSHAAVEQGRLNRWMMRSLSVGNMLVCYQDIGSRIELEEIPSSGRFLIPLLEAIRESRRVQLTYQSFHKDHAGTFIVEPYGVKLFRQRWYLIANSVDYCKVQVYALDRIVSVAGVGGTFSLPEEFSLKSFFKGSYGITVNDGTPFATVRLKVAAAEVGYFRTLPLHESQREVRTEAGYSIFEYELFPTFDFRKDLLSYGAAVEVLAPDSLRAEMREAVERMSRLYR